MNALLTDFLVKLCMAVLDKLIAQGSAAYQKYADLKAELDKNASSADQYNKVVSNPKSSREERRKAEDESLG